jgi:hypothetical protein
MCQHTVPVGGGAPGLRAVSVKRGCGLNCGCSSRSLSHSVGFCSGTPPRKGRAKATVEASTTNIAAVSNTTVTNIIKRFMGHLLLLLCATHRRARDYCRLGKATRMMLLLPRTPLGRSSQNTSSETVWKIGIAPNLAPPPVGKGGRGAPFGSPVPSHIHDRKSPQLFSKQFLQALG